MPVAGPSDAIGVGTLSEHSREPLRTLRETARQVGRVLVHRRQILAWDDGGSEGDRLERRVRISAHAGWELEMLEAAANTARAYLEHVLDERALDADGRTGLADESASRGPSQAGQVRAELAVGWRRIGLALEQARDELRGRGEVTVLPDWRRGVVVTVMIAPVGFGNSPGGYRSGGSAVT